MPKYVCLNPECKLFDKLESRDSRDRYDRILGEVIDSGATCTECGRLCRLQLPKEYSTNLINRP